MIICSGGDTSWWHAVVAANTSERRFKNGWQFNNFSETSGESSWHGCWRNVGFTIGTKHYRFLRVRILMQVTVHMVFYTGRRSAVYSHMSSTILVCCLSYQLVVCVTGRHLWVWFFCLSFIFYVQQQLLL